jgi:hypothetical protein
MNSIKGFSLSRFLLLLRNDIFLNRTYFLIYSGAVVVLLLLISSLHIQVYTQIKAFTLPDFYIKAFPLFLYTYGAIITVKIFDDVNDEAKGAAWLTLPASSIEKFAGRFFLSTFLFIAGMMILFFLTSLISESLNPLMFGSSHLVFNPFGTKVFITSLKYFIIQSLFLAGAIYFKKTALIKTGLCFVIYCVALNLIIGLGGMILFGESSSILFSFPNPASSLSKLIIKNSMAPMSWDITKSIYYAAFWYFLTIFCWVIGFIRLKETEV